MTNAAAVETYATYQCRDRRQAILFANGIKIALRRLIDRVGGRYDDHFTLDQRTVRVKEGSLQPQHLERLLGMLEPQYGPIKRI